ncbi:butanoate--CoA ligase AAE1-like [Solanum lycopersicum]|uniref:Uncharacterized protein n=1 Tax=Solanum lycopersicum TaxID=4081 RepID=A0A3Q7F6A2_SOLLC|nr:probable acyl-activating enzyme 1, peroxisomal [Solanum lycopersicum]
MEGLVVCPANHVPLTPLSFLERAAFVYRKNIALIYGNISYSWEELHGRCINLASALSQLGVSSGDVVATVAPNVAAQYELHFGVPMAGAVLSALNTMLDATTLAQKLQQLEAKIIFVYSDFIELVLQALAILQEKDKSCLIVLIHEGNNVTKPPVSSSGPSKILDYQTLLEMGQPNFKIMHPKNEFDPISINFTSGSTGKPKGAVYSHRAAYLNTIADIFRYEMGKSPVFLWTVDMFRCNGWCLPWTIAALGGTNVCLSEINGKDILDAIYLHNVSHFCGAPMILTKIANAMGINQPLLPHKVNVTVAGVLPQPEILIKLEKLGFTINHAYGMSEALGPMISMPWKFQDEHFSKSNQDVDVKIREGVHNIMMEEVDVKDPESMKSVPADGKTTGEIMFRGNAMMMGYLKDSSRTEEAFEGGWYRTKDLGVKYANGNIKLKDRAVDVVKTDGKTISTLEIEGVLIRHPMVLEVAVVARCDDVLGETPCAFVKLKKGCFMTDEEIIKFCEDWLQDYMVPKAVIFGDLPFNSSGKIQKFILRDKVNNAMKLCLQVGCNSVGELPTPSS